MPAKQTHSQDPIGPSQPSIARNVLTFLACLGVLLALWIVVRLKEVVVLAVIAVVLATGLAPAVVWLENRKLRGNRRMPRAVAILLVYAAAFVVLSGSFTLVLVPLVQQGIEFSKHLPEYLSGAEEWLGDIHSRYPQVPDYAHVVSKAQSQLSKAGEYVTGSVGAVFGFLGGVVSFFTVLVFAFYILLAYEGIRDNVMDLIPKRQHAQARKTMGKMSAAMGGWLRGTVLLSAIVGAIIAVVMLILDVPYAYVIGVVGAIGEPIPMVGPLAAAIIAVIITAFGPSWKLAVVVVFFVILSAVESNVLAPKMMQRHVGLSPLATIVALASGAALLGAVGALLAVPVAAALRVLYYEVVVPSIKKGHAAGDTASKSE